MLIQIDIIRRRRIVCVEVHDFQFLFFVYLQYSLYKKKCKRIFFVCALFLSNIKSIKYYKYNFSERTRLMFYISNVKLQSTNGRLALFAFVLTRFSNETIENLINKVFNEFCLINKLFFYLLETKEN